MTRGLISIGGVLAAAVLFVALNVLAGAGLSRARVDLTQNKLYTLSEGSRNIARKLDEPIKLTLYFSEKQAAQFPAHKSYATRVKEVLREYAAASGGKITVEVVNPEPFSEVEDRAVQAGLMGAPTGRAGGAGGERFYFGLVGTDSTNNQEVIPFFRPDREEFLEYELTRIIYLLSNPTKKTIGVMSWLPIDGSQGNPMMGRQAQTPPWQVIQQIKEVFTVKTLERDAAEIPADVKVLMLVHPKSVPDKTLFAIDQFVLRGGRVLAFVDPYCEADLPPGINPMQAMGLPRNSNLKKLFDAWGVELTDGKFAADRGAALAVQAGSQGRPETVDYVAWLSLQGDDAFDRGDSVTGSLHGVNIATAGILHRKDGATTTLTPLIHTTTDSMPMDVQQVQMAGLDPELPKRLLAGFVPGGQSLTVAARITGPAKTAFPEGKPPDKPPAPTPPPGSPDAEKKDEANPAEGGPWLKDSAEPINVIVVADCDFLTDRFWLRPVPLGGVTLYDKFADNGDLVIGALDNLSGSSDLISVRARATSARPFDRFKRIQKDAEQTYLAKEQALQAKLHETEAKISDLQRQRPDSPTGAGPAPLFTPEQQSAIEKFRKEMVDTRKQLREVQHQLQKDIEWEKTKVKIGDIAVMPLVVGTVAVGLGAWRSRRRRVDRWTVRPRS